MSKNIHPRVIPYYEDTAVLDGMGQLFSSGSLQKSLPTERQLLVSTNSMPDYGAMNGSASQSRSGGQDSDTNSWSEEEQQSPATRAKNCPPTEAELLRTLLWRLTVLLFLSLLTFFIPFSVAAKWRKGSENWYQILLLVFSFVTMAIYQLCFVTPWFKGLLEVNEVDKHFEDWKEVEHSITAPRRLFNWLFPRDPLDVALSDASSSSSADTGPEMLCCHNCCTGLGVRHWSWEPLCFLLLCRRCWFYVVLGSKSMPSRLWPGILGNGTRFRIDETSGKRLWVDDLPLLLTSKDGGKPNDAVVSACTTYYLGSGIAAILYFLLALWLFLVVPLSDHWAEKDALNVTTLPPGNISFESKCMWFSFASLPFPLLAWATLGAFLSVTPRHVFGLEPLPAQQLPV